MKKFIYISGIVIINIFVFGALFKIMHWPGANVLIMLGLGSFCIGFLPLAFIHSYKGNGNQYKSLYIAGFICAFITFIGAMFKILHWPGAGWFLLVGIPLPFLYFLPMYIYHQNKAKEKSAVNLLGVMFLMVYVAVFSAILALNVSRDILNTFVTTENDIAKTNDLFANKNKLIYENLEKSGIARNKEKLAQLKTKSAALYTQLNNIKIELVKSAENSDSKAIEAGNKINTSAIFAKDESAGTTKIMRGDDGVSGKAAELKKQINIYNEYLKSLTGSENKSVKIIDALLNTNDSKDTLYGETTTTTWEDQFFPNGSYIVSTLVSLSSIETNIRMAESEALSILKD
jgi:hypothetical protein